MGRLGSMFALAPAKGGRHWAHQKECMYQSHVAHFLGFCLLVHEVINLLGEPDAVADPELAPNVVKCSKKKGVF